MELHLRGAERPLSSLINDPADRVARPTQVSRKPPPTYLFRLTQPGARINDSVALVSLPSHCLWDELLWSGVGVPQRRPFLPILIRLLYCGVKITIGGCLQSGRDLRAN